MSRFLGIIPARGDSKGVYNKNLRLLGGRPLIHYTITAALASQLLDHIIVSSDSCRILEYASQFRELDIPFVRPACLATDEAPSHGVVAHALSYFEKMGTHYDYAVLLQPTTPFRSEGLIDRAISRVCDLNAESLVTVSKTPHRFHPDWAFKGSVNQLEMFKCTNEKMPGRRQDLPVSFHRDGKVYISGRQLVASGKLVGGRLIGLDTSGEPDINIDTYEDWENAERFIQTWKSQISVC